MLNCERKICFYSLIVLLILNFSCTNTNLKGQTFVNVGMEKSKAAKTKVKFTNSPSSIRKPWQVGIFRGLVMGKTSIDDLQKVLGKPLEIADLETVGIDEWAYHYQIQDDIKGKLIAHVNKKTKIVINIELRPDSMTREEVLNYYGDDYVITRYTSDDCLRPTFDSAPEYEDPNGESWYIEYRDKGIVISIFDYINDEDYNTVQFISYLSKPFGSQFSKCPNLEKK